MHTVRIPEHITDRLLQRRGRLHIYDRLVGGSTALVVVDLQNVFMLRGMPLEVPYAREIVPSVNRLATAVRNAGGTVAWLQITADDPGAWSSFYDRLGADMRQAIVANMTPGSHGHSLHADLDVQADDLRVEKTRYSAFIQGASTLDNELRRRGIDTLVIVGTLTNVCCEASARTP